MKNLNTYIIEKLKITKDSKIVYNKWSENKLRKSLKRSGEIYLNLVFDYEIKDDKGNKIISLYMEGNNIMASFKDNEKNIEYEYEIYDFSDLLTNDECQELYNYLYN